MFAFNSHFVNRLCSLFLYKVTFVAASQNSTVKSVLCYHFLDIESSQANYFHEIYHMIVRVIWSISVNTAVFL